MPFTLLRRLECVLQDSKEAVLAEKINVQKMNVPEDAQEKLLLRATNGLPFFNTSKMDLSTLGETGIKANLENYIQGFSKDAREIFEYFNFAEFIGEAVRYKLSFDRYIGEKRYTRICAMIAISSEVEFTDKDPNAAGLLGEKFSESTMNTGLKGRDMRKAFDSEDYQVMIAADKFQTAFDQPKLCAMYVDKKLGGVECVQTLSRLNRTYPGKAETDTFVLDFFNEPEDIRSAFQPYYQTAELADVSNPNLIFDLFDKLRATGIFLWQEVEHFCVAFFVKSKSNAAIPNICKPAVERWQHRYQSALHELTVAKDLFARAQQTGDAMLTAND
ncbi:MAG: hypothetical protein NPIRA05_19810 [Nitrospirales bacterium]|nr:MAG: hypothetical protein NPIRA05_19810 [Nitrospirales bacterium]GJL70780.1 MAG: hypothetical protein NPIRA06_34150 [Nitrospirales bacterium]